MDKKKLQLGMNPATAANRLRKALLFKFVTDAGHTCYRCGKPLESGNFSVEHKEPWLDSDDPSGLFFDLSNIAFSHLSCNIKAARKPNKLDLTDEERCEKEAARSKAYRSSLPEEVKKLRRRVKYEKHGF